ncbi:energy transducer TonB [Acidicapsa dinghuensis]|uniref:Energy transducer TonB n=1 Tax=Acidicapsa dinghuensis TaxID=2218256 RepID=A0ABW1EM62_9BACT|nr:energy transducer TonB [Acidicapsa dinghuensis]
MQVIRWVPLLALLVGSRCFAAAQQLIEIDQKTLNEHVLHRVHPVYPAIAKAAHFSGTVVLDVVVGTTGKIESIKAVSGNSLLIPAATDCVKQWIYKPFENGGQPATAHGKVSIVFSLGDDPKNSPPPPESQISGSQSQTVTITLAPPDERGKPDEEIATRYFSAHNECTKQVIA